MTYIEACHIVWEAFASLDLISNANTIKLDAELKDYGDSLDLVNVTIWLEEKVKCTFPDDLSQFKIIDDIVKFVELCELK